MSCTSWIYHQLQLIWKGGDINLMPIYFFHSFFSLLHIFFFTNFHWYLLSQNLLTCPFHFHSSFLSLSYKPTSTPPTSECQPEPWRCHFGFSSLLMGLGSNWLLLPHTQEEYMELLTSARLRTGCCCHVQNEPANPRSLFPSLSFISQIIKSSKRKESRIALTAYLQDSNFTVSQFTLGHL